MAFVLASFLVLALALCTLLLALVIFFKTIFTKQKSGLITVLLSFLALSIVGFLVLGLFRIPEKAISYINGQRVENLSPIQKLLQQQEQCEKEAKTEAARLACSEAALEQAQELGHKALMSDCVNLQQQLVEKLRRPEDSWPPEMTAQIESYCELKTKLKETLTPETISYVEFRLKLIQRAWIETVLSKINGFYLVAELQFLPTWIGLQSERLNCHDAESEIKKFIELGSSQALSAKVVCEALACQKRNDFDCVVVEKAVQKLIDRNVPEGYHYLTNFKIEKSPVKHQAALEKAEQLGMIHPRVRSWLTTPFKYTQALALSALKAETTMPIVNSDIEKCAQATLLASWEYGGTPFDPLSITKSEWIQRVNYWGSKEGRNPMMFTKFACEVISAPEIRAEMIGNSSAPDVLYESSFDLCKNAKDVEFQQACEYSK